MSSENRKRITRMTLEQRPPRTGRIDVRDNESPLIFRLASTGHKSFCVRARIGNARQPVRFTYPKSVSTENLADARKWARETVDACRAGHDPREIEQAAQTAEAVAAARAERLKCKNVVAIYLDRRVRREKQNRTADEIARMFAIYVLPRWGDRLVTEIDRQEVNALLNDVFDRKIVVGGRTYGGNVAADRLLAQIRSCFNWYALQDSKFTSPIVPGMARTSPRARKRTRVLSDEEIRALWPLLPAHGVFGAIVKSLLLSAQRLAEVSEMARSEIAADGTWTIPAERYKTGIANVVPMPTALRAVIDDQPVLTLDGKTCPYVFSTNAISAFSGMSKAKDRLDAALLAALRKTAGDRGGDADKVTLPDWRLHDLRRTAKTLMARAGVRPDISERVLGHVIPGVEGIYDQHDYVPEKRAALEALATMINRILAGPADNVVPFREAAE